MDSSTTRKTSSGSAKQAALVIQNGRLRGTRRSFGYPTTFLGSGASSDVRLSVDGISPLHSVVIQANGELILRDLDSLTGTFVNGRKVTNHTLRNNDQVTVGPFQFVVEIPEGSLTVGWSSDSGPKPLVALEVSSREKAALRIQVAAVVAQQAALTDAECRLHQRQTTLEQQQAQLASHLEDKRTRLLEMQTQIQAARQALQQERQEYGRHVEDVKQNLSQAQQELLDEQAEAQATRKRLAKLHMRLRKRFENNWNRGRRDIEQREKNLEVAYQRLQEDFNRLTKEKEQLHNQSARANSEIALARGKLEDQRTTFRNEQRKIQEQQANQLREFRKATQELRMGEKALLEAEKMFHKEKKQAEDYLELLKAEAIGLEYRIQHQRELLAQVQESDQERVGREQGTEDREQQKAKSDGQRANVGKRHSSFDFQASEALPDRNYPLVVQRSTLEGSKGEDLEPRVDQPIRSEISTLNSQLAVPSKDETRTRLQELDAVAGELIDQRAQVLESWEQLLKVRLEWEGQQQSTNREVRELVVKLHQQAQTLLVQEEQLAVTRGSVAEQFEELQSLRQQLVAWQSRLKAREVNWEGERERFLAELRSREEYTAQHLQSLADLRQRWAECRRKELESVKTVHEAAHKARQEYIALSEERRHQIQQTTEERQTLSTKALAVEQYRQECLTRSNDEATADRRIERLRRRWEATQTVALRATQEQNQELETELIQLRAQNKELSERLTHMEGEAFTFTNEQAEWQRQQLRANNKQVELQQQVQSLQGQRDQAICQITQLEAEIERVAKLLIEAPRTPVTLRLPEESADSDQPALLDHPGQVQDDDNTEDVDRAA